MSDILETYSKELTDHLSIDEFNLKDVQLQLPGRKHIWVGRLMRHKLELNRLRNKKKGKLVEVTKKIQEQSNIRLSSPAAVKVAENSDFIKNINSEIEEKHTFN